MGDAPKKARGKSDNLKPWKPGQSGNPAGRAPMPEDMRAASDWGPALVRAAINLVASRSEAELDALVLDPTAPRIVVALGKMMVLAIEKGDHQRLEFLLQRAIGKVQDRVEISTPTPFIIRHLSGEQTVLGAKVEKPDEE